MKNVSVHVRVIGAVYGPGSEPEPGLAGRGGLDRAPPAGLCQPAPHTVPPPYTAP
jgi:hypothetical protein